MVAVALVALKAALGRYWQIRSCHPTSGRSPGRGSPGRGEAPFKQCARSGGGGKASTGVIVCYIEQRGEIVTSGDHFLTK